MKRYKNVYFWLGLLGALVAASGVDFETLTSWPLLWEAFKGVVMNPVAIAAVVMAGVGVWVNPTTKGIKDK